MNKLLTTICGLALVLSAASCVKPASKSCIDGLVCPEGTQCAAKQAVCIKDNCGNGTLDPGELCDDGNIVDKDGCSKDCKSNETCGNKTIDTAVGEICDDGNTVSGDGCSADCMSREGCGNGVLDTSVGEVCDDGNNIDGDGCSADCRSNETCGNGRTDAAKGEVCDDGNNKSGDGCSADCKSNETCGNHIVDVAKGEACDDGNNADLDGCSANCKSNETCGNGYLDSDKGEVCDDGNNVDGDGCAADCSSEETCGNDVRDKGEECDTGTQSATCNSNCTFVRCGDKIINTAAGEQCDTGGQSATCNANCSADLCGDGIVNSLAGEQCDNIGAVDSKTCNKDCTVAYCGDGKINAANNEQCDDKGESPTCNADCTSKQCGDGVINTMAGEQCDTKGGADTTTCNGNTGQPAPKRCQLSVCGDGYTNATTEACDDAGPSLKCNADCTLNVCGDGKLDPVTEECDDGNTNSHDGCVGCKLAKCGDNVIWYGHERCDDGNTTADGNGCSADCTTSTKCGDGHTDTALGEVCDDSNNVSGDGCSADCLSNETCGNRYVDVAKGEKCDDGNTTQDNDGCSPDCKTSTKCGNNIVDSNLGEICDDGNVVSGDGCSSDCISNETCGNGYIDTAKNETCDDGNVFDSDACPSTCRVAFCGDGFTEAVVEECDDKNTDNTDACISCKNAFCGDGFLHASVEACDDGAKMNNDGCSSTCTIESGYSCMTGGTGKSVCTPNCGDGVTVGTEVCDDHNALSCGQCAAGCGTTQPAAKAHGSIVAAAGSALRDGETLTLSDGELTFVFEFDVSATSSFNGVTAGHQTVQVHTTDSATVVAAAIVTAINGVLPLELTAASSTATVTINADNFGSYVNVTILETVQSPTFTVSGMTGGAADDCPDLTGCSSPNDCRSGVCTGNVCQHPSCSDTIKNGDETDTNCGGSCSNSCADGLGCITASDCMSGFCTNNACGTAYMLTVSNGINGSVKSTSVGILGGINCGVQCNDLYPKNATATLQATANLGYAFAGWSGACTNATGNCVVLMNGIKSVAATWVKLSNINVTPKPSNGTISGGTGSMIVCGTAGTVCTEQYKAGQIIALTATPDSGYLFATWLTGPCAVSAPTNPACNVTVGNVDTNVSASFSAIPDMTAPPVDLTHD